MAPERVTFLFPGLLEILQAVDPLLGNLQDKKSQDELLQKLVHASNSGEIGEDVMLGMTTQLRNKIGSWVTDHGNPSYAGPQSRIPNIADFWASGEKVFRDDFMELIKYEESDGKQSREKYAPLKKAASGQGSAAKSVKRKAVEDTSSKEKKQKRDGSVDALDSQITELVEKGPQLDASTEAPGEEEPEIGDKRQKSVATKAKSKQAHPQLSEVGDSEGDDDEDNEDHDGEYSPEQPKGKSMPAFGTSSSSRQGLRKRLAPQKINTLKSTQDDKNDRQQETARAHNSQESALPPKHWSLQRSLIEIPKILPTSRVANRSEKDSLCSGDYVTNKLETISLNILLAVRCCFRENQIENDAPFKVIQSPEPELEDLHKTLWGSGTRWQTTLSRLETRTPPVIMLQGCTMMGLMGASIFKSVFQTDLPWDMTAELGSNLKYLEQVVDDLGHELEDVLKYLKTKQIDDPEFRKGKVEALTQKLSGSLELALLPYVKQMTKSETILETDPLIYERWPTYLDIAFRTAIILKQHMQASRKGPFYIEWPEVDEEALDCNLHQDLAHHFERGRERFVLHNVLPRISADVSGERLVFSKPWVISAAR